MYGSFATILFAEEISGETGGETLYADTRQAYASLSEDVQKKAQQTVLLHSYVYKVLWRVFVYFFSFDLCASHASLAECV